MGEMARGRLDINKIIVCAVWCIYFMAHFFLADIYAQEREEYMGDGRITVKVTFNYQDEEEEEITLRAGRDFAVRFEVVVKEEFSGYVNVLMQNEGGEHVLYQQKLGTIPAGGSTSCQMLLPMNLMTEGLYLTLTEEDGTVRLERTVPVGSVNYGLYEMTGVFDPAGEEEYKHFSSYGARLVAVSESELACGAQAMDALEIIVTQEQVLEELEERVTKSASGFEEGKDGVEEIVKLFGQDNAVQVQESLKEWVAGGKTLVVGASAGEGKEEEMLNLGLQEKEILQEVILSIGNYEATRESILATNEEIKRQYGSDARTSYIGDSMIGAVSVNSLSDDAVSVQLKREEMGQGWWNSGDSYEILWQERGIDILRCYRVGKGNVLVFAIPVTKEQQEVYPLFYYRMVGLVHDNLTQMQLSRQNMEMYGNTKGNRTYLLSYIQAKNAGVSVFPYVVILMVYILVLIPAVFILLRYFRKTKYLWGVLPVLSFFVMAVVYFTGMRTRIVEPYCTYLDIMDYAQEKHFVNFSLSAPTNGGAQIMLKEGYAVRLAQTGFRPYEMGWLNSVYVRGENVLRARDYRAAVCVQPEGMKLSVDSSRAFSNTNFAAWTDLPAIGGALNAKVTASDKVVAGAISNTTEMSFREVYLCNQNYAVCIGKMEPGEEIKLEDCMQSIAWEDEEGYVGGGIYWLLSNIMEEAGMEQRVLYFLIEDYIYENGEQTFIFAFPVEEECELLGDAVNNPGSNGHQVFIWPLEDK